MTFIAGDFADTLDILNVVYVKVKTYWKRNCKSNFSSTLHGAA